MAKATIKTQLYKYEFNVLENNMIKEKATVKVEAQCEAEAIVLAVAEMEKKGVEFRYSGVFSICENNEVCDTVNN